MAEIHPVHHSIRHPRISPRNMERIPVTIEQAATLDRIALDVFTDMTNAGATFQEALSAVYLSGFVHAVAANQQRGIASQQ